MPISILSQLSDLVDLGLSMFKVLYFDPISLEERMAVHSGILAWRIPWTEELGKLQSMGS